MRNCSRNLIDIRLSGRPCQRSAAKNMNVQMEHTLPAVRTCVDNSPITTVKPKNLRHLRDSQQQVSTEPGVIRSQLIQRHNRFFGNQQHMHGRLWSDIAKRQAHVIFIDNIRRDFAVDDFEENRQYRLHRKDKPARDIRTTPGIVNADRFWCNQVSVADSQLIALN